MKAYKGFNKDLTCRGFQYEQGKSYEMDTAVLCESGFHACEMPLDVLNYYAPCNSVFHEVELDGVCVDSGGRAWYDVLEPIGYYVPYDQRTEENDWYGKDMVLTDAQATQVRNFVVAYDVYNGKSIANLIAAAKCDGDDVVINADW